MAPTALPPPSGPPLGGTSAPLPGPAGGGPHRLRFALVVVAAAAALVVGAVLGTRAGSDDTSTPGVSDTRSVATSERPPVTDRPPVSPATTAAPRSTTPATSPVPVTFGEGVMPDVVCMNLQAAQDEIQKHGVFFSRSKDATGQGRRQILDRNWTVVAQSPAPGEPIGEGDAVLSVVKNDEPNDC